MFLFSQKSKPAQNLVMVFGAFDFLHAGHENFLKQARELGDHLLVVLARDNTIRSLKGKSPQNSEKTRLKNLRQTNWADQVILGNHDNKHQVILDHRPAIIALGFNQFVFTQTIQKTLIENQLNTEIVRMEAYFPPVHRSSLFKTKTIAHQDEKVPQTQD